ncbi:MAG: methyltransferase domain-containing protein, partial [Candidatus Staskawiczbacteria bacterium]|nr:methyltransferase domain-containing protein [Candidatus Staskawiczbacteria bacterium]
MNNYLGVRYNKNTKPYTAYPLRMCRYLFKRFGMKKGDKLLDIGCGRGDFTRAFKDLSLEVVGVDREKGDTELLKGIDIRIQNDLENDRFPFEDNS